MRAAGLLVWLLCSASAAAGTIHNAAVTYQSGSFIVEVDALVDVTEPTARALLTDYNHLEQLNPAVERSEILETHGPGEYRVRTVTQTCLWFYCKRLTRVQDVVEAHDGSITAIVIPELSDFSYGTMRLNLWQEVAGTRILMRSEVAPDFWIPPLLGPWLIKRELRAEAVQTVHSLERVAAEVSQSDPGQRH
ncbi:MAG: hypothetical protein U9Q19_01700 [Pseudomonadota bacterium]|nr:hypothetical protein [Pseudomonadota bacterium]